MPNIFLNPQCFLIKYKNSYNLLQSSCKDEMKIESLHSLEYQMLLIVLSPEDFIFILPS